jgi:hypothetical protein
LIPLEGAAEVLFKGPDGAFTELIGIPRDAKRHAHYSSEKVHLIHTRDRTAPGFSSYVFITTGARPPGA